MNFPTLSAFHEQISRLWTPDQYHDDDYIREAGLQAHWLIASLLSQSIDGLPEPTSYRQAVLPSNPERDQWEAAIKKELDTLVERQTWAYVPLASLPRHPSHHTLQVRLQT